MATDPRETDPVGEAPLGGEGGPEGAPRDRTRSAVPSDAPARCPVCAAAYDSVSVHDGGLMVNLLDNERYRRVCFEPGEDDGTAVVRFYHHTHEQA
jgi:hypothetical protein